MPDHLITVFAGADIEAAERARGYFTGYPPSSPSIALLRDGQLVYMLERSQIEGRNAPEVARQLTEAFDRFCLPRPIEIGELLAQVRNLGKVVHHNVSLVRMMDYVVLMVSLSSKELTAAAERRYNRTLKDLSLIELVNVGLRDALLIFVNAKDRRAILCAVIRPLAI